MAWSQQTDTAPRGGSDVWDVPAASVLLVGEFFEAVTPEPPAPAGDVPPSAMLLTIGRLLG